VLVLLISGCGLIFTAMLGSGISNAAAACGVSGTVVVAPSDVQLDPRGITIAGQPMTDEQVSIAETIIGVAVARNKNAKGVAVLRQDDVVEEIQIGLQETKLTNPESGSGDSLGTFQMSPSNGWGSPEQIMDVVYAVNEEYDHLIAVPNRFVLTPLELALQIQHPNPAAYNSPSNNFDSWRPTASQILARTTIPTTDNASKPQNYDASCAVSSVPGNADSKVKLAVQYALSVIGTPYVWGGESETGGFDCSGLVWWAFSQAGFAFSRTTAAGEYDWGTPVELDQLQTGDLVFWAYDPSDPSTIHHVAIYYRDGQIIAAPHTGDVVKIEPLYDVDHMLAVRVEAADNQSGK
jgi:cell wall-associated NlpC family hydrolase